jgi:hypothetical protein
MLPRLSLAAGDRPSAIAVRCHRSRTTTGACAHGQEAMGHLGPRCERLLTAPSPQSFPAAFSTPASLNVAKIGPARHFPCFNSRRRTVCDNRSKFRGLFANSMTQVNSTTRSWVGLRKARGTFFAKHPVTPGQAVLGRPATPPA